MAHPTVVLLAAGLSLNLVGDRLPSLRRFARACGGVRPLLPDLPAVTCTVQSSMLTGLPPGRHGAVANGWYERDSAEIRFWRQSNRLVQGEKVWETAARRDPTVTTANLFWWFDMYSGATYAVTPRPMYPADGRKIPVVWTQPPEWRDLMQSRLGRFPLFHFWGPASDIRSTTWIAGCAMEAWRLARPTLTLVYLPHMDYCLQKSGPAGAEIPRELRELDRQLDVLLEFFQKEGVRPIVVSEYGIEPVTTPVPLNLVLRREGLLRLRMELGREQLDAGASAAFAVVDHQVAHVYLERPEDVTIHERVAAILRQTPGVEQVLDRAAQESLGLAHARSGDFLCVAAPGHWFSYGWWEDPARAPDYARTVDIHRKPGYDPCELILDPALRLPWFRTRWTLLKRALGLRSLMEVIPLDASLVRGSHGRVEVARGFEPLLIADNRHLPDDERLHCRRVRDVILSHLFD